jgi:tRNA threonylcarbamoyladenosine biosynthesis protein TsaE
MTTHATWHTITTSAEQTERLAERLGAVLQGGEVIELVSDLGGGKTTFSRGLVRALGSTDTVASPTFTISKVYDAGQLQVHHFDFYRLHEAGIIADELAEVAGDPQTITLVEWADVVKHVLPGDRLTITIAQTPEGYRKLSFSAPASLNYLLEAVQGV